MSRYSSKSWRAFRPDARVGEPRTPGATAAEKSAATIVKLRAPSVATLNNGRCRILGLDPGSLRTGYGIVDCVGADYRYVAHGCINVASEDMTERLRRIHLQVAELVREHAPDEAAIERVFVNRNVQSALKLGQARGAALCALPQHLTIGEYAPRAVKLATVGFGAASKHQVSHMVQRLLQLDISVTADAADALAVAICHAHARRLAALTGDGCASGRMA